MENLVDEINYYDEKMLRLQYEASECFLHNLTKGEAREDFIKDLIYKKTGNEKILKGCIYKKNYTSTQLDIIICKNNAICNQIGTHYLIDAEDCKYVIEVKSKLNNKYLSELAKNAEEIKNMNSEIKIGMFAYSLETKSILKSFGHIYDKELDMYEYDETKIVIKLKSIDFVICIDENNEFVVINENGKFELYRDSPIIKYFWPMIRK